MHYLNHIKKINDSIENWNKIIYTKDKRKMKSKDAEKYMKKLLNNMSLFPQIGRVFINSNDLNKIEDWIKISDKKDKTNTHLAARIAHSKPFLETAFYVVSSLDKENNKIDITGFRLKYEDDGLVFACYPFEKDGKAPTRPRFGFKITKITTRKDINEEEEDPYVVDYCADVIHNDFYPKEKEQKKVDAFLRVWGVINYFMINFERDIQVTTYKGNKQSFGTSKNKKKQKKYITRKTYRCHLPDNWIAINKKQYNEPDWDVNAHWHKNLVNEDYLERKKSELGEEEFNKKYKLSTEQPNIEGKIYVDILYDKNHFERDESLLSNNASGVSVKEYAI